MNAKYRKVYYEPNNAAKTAKAANSAKTTNVGHAPLYRGAFLFSKVLNQKKTMKHTDTPITLKGSVKVANRFAKLFFKFSKLGTDATDLIDNLSTGTLEVKKTHPTYGTKTVVYENPIADYLEIASCNEGAVRADNDGTTSIVRGTLELTPDGSLVPMENEVYTVTIDSLPAGVSVEIFSIDVPKDASRVYDYNPVNVNANAPTPVTVKDAQWLAVRRTGLKMVELEMPNKQKVTYLPEEIEQILSEINEQSFVINGLVTPAGRDLYCIPVGLAHKAYITQSTVGTVYVVNQL